MDANGKHAYLVTMVLLSHCFYVSIYVLVKAIVGRLTKLWQIVRLDYIVKTKQLYTCTMEFMNFINTQAISSALAVLVHVHYSHHLQVYSIHKVCGVRV